jgi:hypothetical protein
MNTLHRATMAVAIASASIVNARSAHQPAAVSWHPQVASLLVQGGKFP